MTQQSSAIGLPRVSPLAGGTAQAALGVLAFSLTFPATSWALGGFGAWTTVGVRGTVAALIAGVALIGAHAPRPSRADLPGLLVVAGGCAIGFPLLSTLALSMSSTAHSAVVIGLLPLATAAVSALLTGHRPSRVFWLAAGAGAAAVVTFTLAQNHGRPSGADLLLFAALLVCAAGYAEGGRLARRLPGWQVIAWGVVLAAPVNLAVAAWAGGHEPVHVTARALLGLVYVAAVSQFLGFVVWYRGMAALGVARASQLQLAQPLLTLVWAVALLGEHLAPSVPLTAVIVLACIVVTQRARA